MKAYRKDIWRTILHSRKRFLAIMVICVLGCAMFSGLTAACRDLERSADAFFDRSCLHDLKILSTAGLVEDDIKALKKIAGISSAVGIYGTTATIRSDNEEWSSTIQTMASDGTDDLTVLSGTVPSKKGEAAVTSRFLKDSGLKVGDFFEADEKNGSNQIQAAAGSQTENGQKVLSVHRFKISAEVLDPTSVNNPNGSVSYRDASSSGYSVYVTEQSIAKRSDLPYMAAVVRVKGTKNLLCYSSSYKKMIRNIRRQIEENVKSDQEEKRFFYIQNEAYLSIAENEKEASLKIESARQELDGNRKELEKAERELESNRQRLERSERQIEENRSSLAQSADNHSLRQLDEAQAEITENRQKLDEAQRTLEENKKKLDEGEASLNEEQQKLEDEVSRAKDKVQNMDRPKWYIQDRESMSGYANIGSDADSIQAIANVFPVVFFIVAILISLTSVTRMVEEERELIGTYKAIGFSNFEISGKYLIYSFLASACGSFIGNLLAFIALPSFIFMIFRTMYLLPGYRLGFYPSYGFLGPSLFIGGIVLAAFFALREELAQTPAALMRPKAPRPGIRTLLERMPFIWRRLSFSGKVTARNIFRYKKRMLMTVFGVAGCMALLLFGFGIQDSVHDLMPRQYEQVFHYDLLAASETDENEQLLRDADVSMIRSYINVFMTTASLKKTENSSQELSLTVIVFPENADIGPYLSMTGRDGQKLNFSDGDILITMNAGNVLGFSDGDDVFLQLEDLTQANLPNVTTIRNYLGNYVYMRQSTFEKYFGACDRNAIMANLSDDVKDQGAFCDRFAKKEGVISCVSTQKLADSFATAFRLIDVVVYIIILMSAALSFTVLFTLLTTNISERERELATIKVLGFYDREVHAYFNRETWILTAVGIVLGMPLGYAFAQTLTTILNLPSIYLAVSLHPVSYLYAAVLSVSFALLVSLIGDHLLNRIDPTTALKSIE